MGSQRARVSVRGNPGRPNRDYPMHDEPHARASLLRAVKDYQQSRISAAVYKTIKSNIFARWPALKPEGWQ